ncbi:Na+/H+ antiporter subunit [Afipia carboxidovorans OM5]|uniref:K+/H+ antiporter subunit G n=1 Tax=Afipia carboxidovorans (strain ATCC 49405 / DSM 1227 / KCTC 32145 / OM5) TaxID=504832 RepID=B6JCB1_AFIC5|nr:monovalent cation/H(+) antiporter subunit G [Afipia carboxidovorans]ACI92327.1 Na+/H+ antiporter subunit [Afipia carboxidovorans OM5]AEI03890.1 K+/H+ antiporter subunit G [Afipia carboxidovorans OM4]AEI07467.1 K+/H+ antiporter subunit G [Afipia carboxidovorans OM5]BEV45013.1 monovalent cation/H(+) antiporter subunit G [Afipia carboxidovorans]
MNEIEIPAIATIFTSAFLIIGAALTFIGSLGLLRLKKFYEKVHAPTLGTTLGAGFIATSSMIYFSTLASRPAFHELLIVAFVTITTPITLMVLVRAAVFRDELESNETASSSPESEQLSR